MVVVEAGQMCAAELSGAQERDQDFLMYQAVDRDQDDKTPEDKIVETIDAALLKAGEAISAEGMKIADLVKLLQLRKELAKSGPKLVGIRWVGECNDHTPINE